LASGVDYVALSFVQDAEDIANLRQSIRALGKSAGIVAKVERVAALDNLGAILSKSDAVMVARGDLGIGRHFDDPNLPETHHFRSQSHGCTRKGGPERSC
jgi:pyruvate kinase